MIPQIYPCSVALCTYNGEKYVAEMLDSILYQTLVVREIIIVDDCSSDGTQSLLKRYAEKNPQIKLFLLKSNLGPVAAFEKAIQLTSCPFIFLADQDDIWKPNKVEAMLAETHKISQEKPLLVFSDLEVIDEKGKILFPSFWKMASFNPQISTFKSLMFGNVVTGCASLINFEMKKLLISIPDGVLMHDHWIGMIAFGFGNAVVLDQPLVKYRVHGNSVTEKKKAHVFWKLKTQVNQILNQKSNFLEKEINQVALFDRTFTEFLSEENKNCIESFLGLRQKSLLRKKIASFLKHKK